MADAHRRQRTSRTARRKSTLEALAIAAEYLTEQTGSFAALSVERLSRQAGISRASFYLYFEDKGELVRGWLDAFDREVNRLLDSWFGESAPSHEYLARTFASLEKLHRENRFILSAAEEMAAHDATLRQDREEAHRQRRVALRRHITRGQRNGWIDPDLASGATADWLIAMIDRVMRHVAPSSCSALALSATGADVVWRVLYSFPTRR